MDSTFSLLQYIAHFQRVSTRYGQQAELKEQNQHLMATNEQLQKNLTDSQVKRTTFMLHLLDCDTTCYFCLCYECPFRNKVLCVCLVYDACNLSLVNWNCKYIYSIYFDMLSESPCIFAKVLVLLQQRVADLELQFSELEKKNAGLQKNLKDCHALLVAAKVDPGKYVSPLQFCSCCSCFCLSYFSCCLKEI